jgi:putative addiction module component (TIGR02574 family)
MTAALEKEIAGLSFKEKAELLDNLLVQIAAVDPDTIAPSILAEVERRADAYEANPVGFSIEEVEQRLP